MDQPKVHKVGSTGLQDAGRRGQYSRNGDVSIPTKSHVTSQVTQLSVFMVQYHRKFLPG